MLTQEQVEMILGPHEAVVLECVEAGVRYYTDKYPEEIRVEHTASQTRDPMMVEAGLVLRSNPLIIPEENLIIQRYQKVELASCASARHNASMQAIQDLRVFTCWVMLERSDDGDGWIAHCLEFDIISQGDDANHAIEMIKEATAFALVEDLHDGVDPESVRNRAPVEFWHSLLSMMKTGERIPLSKIRSGERSDVKKFATQIVLTFVRVNEMELADTPPPMDSVFSMPPHLQLAS